MQLGHVSAVISTTHIGSTDQVADLACPAVGSARRGGRGGRRRDGPALEGTDRAGNNGQEEFGLP